MPPVDTRPAKSGRAPALPPEQRRAAIVEAALPLVAEHGESITTRQIADAAGVAEGTIFRAFADKDALLVAVLDAALDQRDADAAYAAIDPDLSVRDALLEVVCIVQRRIGEVSAVVSKVRPELREQASYPATDSPVLLEVFERYSAELRHDSTRASRILRALTLAVTHPMFYEVDLSPAEIVEQFLDGATR